MSSHHFVRAEQATCLYFTHSNFDEDLMFQLLEWNPIVIADENMLDWLVSRNVKIDILISASEHKRSELLPYPFDQWQKMNDEEIVSKIIEEVKAARLSFIGCEQIEEIHSYQLSYPDIEITLLEENRKHFLLNKNKYFKKWVDKNYKFSVSNKNVIQLNGDFELINNVFSANNGGTFVIHTNEDIIFTEFL